MNLIRGLHNLSASKSPCVVALGGFDAIHLGHLALIKKALSLAAKLGVEAGVVFFEPLPREFLRSERRQSRVYGFGERVRLLRSLGVDRAISLRFDSAMQKLSAEAFVREILVEKIKARHVVVGEGFRFGNFRKGALGTLRGLGKNLGFSVTAVPELTFNSLRISSTRVREALARGDFSLAEQLLGRPYVVSARVKRGSRRGSEIGFPTANLAIGPRPLALRGVYAVWVSGAEKEPLPGALNAGYRPTFNGSDYTVEVHIVNFSDNLYGCRLSVRVVAKIRDERQFASPHDLREQISEDLCSVKLQLQR